jgi:phage shock protein PspC (stress-responsive transcriptional regulator)
VETDDAPAPAVTAPRRLTRSSSNRVVGGVCGGLAEYTGIDPLIFRIGAVALSLGGGTGVLAYLLAWAFIPADDDERVRTDDGAKVGLIILGLIFGLPLLLLLAIPLFVVTGFGIGGHHRFFVGPVLAIAGLLVVLSRRDGARSWSNRSGGGLTPPPPTSPTIHPFASPGAQPRRADHRLFILTGSVLLLVTAAFTVRRAIDPGAPLDPGPIIASQLLVIAGGLLVGAWYGRSRGLVVLGGLLLLPAWATNAVDLNFTGGVGERIWRPVAEADLQPTYELGLGNATLDLTGLDPLEHHHSLEVRVSVGQLQIHLPDDVPVTVTTTVQVGQIDRNRGGREGTRTYNEDASGERLAIDARVGVGELIVDEGFAHFGRLGDAGPQTWAPVSESDLRSGYSLGSGLGTLDLTGVAGLTTDHVVDVGVGSGNLRVLLPDTFTTTVDAEAGSGHVAPSEGIRTYEGRTSTGRLLLRIRVGSGNVTIERRAS